MKRHLSHRLEDLQSQLGKYGDDSTGKVWVGGIWALELRPQFKSQLSTSICETQIHCGASPGLSFLLYEMGKTMSPTRVMIHVKCLTWDKLNRGYISSGPLLPPHCAYLRRCGTEQGFSSPRAWEHAFLGVCQAGAQVPPQLL